MKLSHLAQGAAEGAAEGAVAQAESAAEEGAARAKEEALAKAREAAWSNLMPYLSCCRRAISSMSPCDDLP